MSLPLLFLLVLFSLCFGGTAGFAQSAAEVARHLRAEGKGFLILGDSSIFVCQDTIIRIQKPQSESNGNDPARFWESMGESAGRNAVTREIYQLVYRSPRPGRQSESGELVRSVSPFLPFQGKTIRTIRVLRLDPFGKSVDDTSYSQPGVLAGLANRIHIDTREKIIRDNLLFETGDPVDPQTMSENERLLRELEGIRDARISLEPVGADSVVARVVVQDMWALALDARVHNPDSLSAKLYFRNLFGFGQIMENEWAFNPSQPQYIGYRGSLEFENLFGYFIRSKIAWTGFPDEKMLTLKTGRDLSYDHFRNRGGLYLGWIESVSYHDTIAKPYHKVFQDVWLGQSREVPSNSSSRTHFLWAAGILKETFPLRSWESETDQILFRNRLLVLATLGLARRDFFNTENLFRQGQTEDIPYGCMGNVQAGYEWAEGPNRWYTSIHLSAGNMLNPGYLQASFELGGFLIPPTEIREGVVRLKLNGFSHLYHLGPFGMRQFFRAEWVQGLGRRDDEYVSLADRDGIRGLRSSTLRGNGKLALNLENVLYSRTNWLDFYYSWFSFVDLGMLEFTNKAISGHSPLYTGLGMGIRLFNDNFFFRALQVRLAYYPVIPPDAAYHLLSLAGQNSASLNQFSLQKPGVLDY